ncbi:hypothetical protein ScPMuIL_013864 [Solemya velum]
MSKTVCIIGAGVSGLASTKQCLDESLLPTCYEKDSDLGGIWNFSETPRHGFPSLYKSCVMNTSKGMTCFSDFPFPPHYPNFLHHGQYKTYLDNYAAHFGLQKYIYFRTEVLRVERATDFESTGRWIVTSRRYSHASGAGHVSEVTYDYVIVCSGHYTTPFRPDYASLGSFKGSVSHSHDYKDPHGFKGKNVLVIGFGSSALDVACELGRDANKVFLSVKNGDYVMPTLSGNGEPWDQNEWTRLNQLINRLIPKALLLPFHYAFLNRIFNQTLFGLTPNAPFNCRQGVPNDTLYERLLSGEITIKPNVSEFFANFVKFEDGTKEMIDSVIFGTGYSFSFPFLRSEDVQIENEHPSLYKGILPVGLHPSSLAMVGTVVVLAGRPPVFEMQARWATRHFRGKIRLPDDSVICANVKLRKMRYTPHFRKAILYDNIEYMDELAYEVGCKPNIWKYLVTDFAFFLKLLSGPVLPQQYRLDGVGSWNGARETIENNSQNVWFPLRTRRAGVGEREGLYAGWIMLFHVSAFAAVVATSVDYRYLFTRLIDFVIHT